MEFLENNSILFEKFISRYLLLRKIEFQKIKTLNYLGKTENTVLFRKNGTYTLSSIPAFFTNFVWYLWSIFRQGGIRSIVSVLKNFWETSACYGKFEKYWSIFMGRGVLIRFLLNGYLSNYKEIQTVHYLTFFADSIS